jgi:FMN phosphatase YigB (HAD superfamily)
MFSSLFRKSTLKSIELDHVQAIFFDLDGTLIDVDMQRFVAGYLRRLTEHMSRQVDPMQAARVLHQAVAAMFANTDAERTLESILFEVLNVEIAMSSQQYEEYLEQFCQNDLQSLRPLVRAHPLSSQLVDSSLSNGWKVVLATNPIFPRPVVDARLAWGDLDGDLFHHITSYETAHFCKPSPAFFEELLDLLQVPAENCLMVGNDPLHDLSASQVGMQTCLLTPWRIKRPGASFKADWLGSHEDLLKMLASVGPAPSQGMSGPD